MVNVAGTNSIAAAACWAVYFLACLPTSATCAPWRTRGNTAQQEVVDDATLMQQVVSNQGVNHMEQDRQKYAGFLSCGLSNHNKVSFVWEIVSISHKDNRDPKLFLYTSQHTS